MVQDKVLKIGKAKQLNNECLEKRNCMNTKDTLKTPYLFLDVHGNVSICTWKCIPFLGNLINEDFSTIETRLQDNFFKLMLEGKIEEAIAYKEGCNIKILKKESKKNGQCYLCIDKYGDE